MCNPLTGDVEEAWQEAVPECTQLIPQALVDLHGFRVQTHVFLFTVGELGPLPPAIHTAIKVDIGVTGERERWERVGDRKRENRIRV